MSDDNIHLVTEKTLDFFRMRLNLGPGTTAEEIMVAIRSYWEGNDSNPNHIPTKLKSAETAYLDSQNRMSSQSSKIFDLVSKGNAMVREALNEATNNASEFDAYSKMFLQSLREFRMTCVMECKHAANALEELSRKFDMVKSSSTSLKVNISLIDK